MISLEHLLIINDSDIPVSKASEVTGVGKNTISKLRRSKGQCREESKKDDVLKLLSECETQKEVAEKLGVDKSYVSRVAKAAKRQER